MEQLVDRHIAEPRTEQLLHSMWQHVMVQTAHVQINVPQRHRDARAKDGAHHGWGRRAEGRALAEEDPVLRHDAGGIVNGEDRVAHRVIAGLTRASVLNVDCGGIESNHPRSWTCLARIALGDINLTRPA
jgi:hypothetical protein